MLLMLANYLKKLTATQKLQKLKRKLLNMIYIYTTIPEFNQLAKKSLDEKLKQANLASKNDIAEFIRKERLWWEPKKN